MWLPPSVRDLHPALAWSGFGLVVFFAFRLLLPPFPAGTPYAATLGVLLAAVVFHTARRKLFARSAAFLVLAAIAYLFAWNRGVPMLYAFSAVCLGVVVVSHALPRWALRRLSGRVVAPQWIAQGDRGTLGVHVNNASGAVARMLEVEVPVEGAITPDARPACTLLVELAAGRSREFELRTPPLRRGRRFAGPLTVRTGFPLGLATAENTVAGSGQHVWVYPRLFNIGFLPVSGEQFLDIGDAISARAGGVEEFAGVREYRHGDSRRHVHWRASAKRGELVVKEFVKRTAATVTIALDMRASACFGEGIDTSTEQVVAVAGSVARYALGRGHHVQLAFGGTTFSVLGPLRGLGALDSVMRALALAEAGGDTEPGPLLSKVAAVAPPDSTVVVAYVDWHLGSLNGLAALRSKNILVVPVAVDAASFGGDLAASTTPALRAPGRERRIRRGENPAKLFVE